MSKKKNIFDMIIDSKNAMLKIIIDLMKYNKEVQDPRIKDIIDRLHEIMYDISGFRP